MMSYLFSSLQIPRHITQHPKVSCFGYSKFFKTTYKIPSITHKVHLIAIWMLLRFIKWLLKRKLQENSKVFSAASKCNSKHGAESERTTIEGITDCDHREITKTFN